jgi:hypothetical protein
MKKLTITYNPEHLGDIPEDEYTDAVEEAIAEHFGGEYEYSICPGSVLSTRIDLDGPWPDDAEETIRHLQQAAWEECCGHGQCAE